MFFEERSDQDVLFPEPTDLRFRPRPHTHEEAHMYCSGCGQSIEQGQTFCSRCGRPLPVAPAVPGLQFQLDAYAGKIRTLSMVWFIYAGITLVLSFMGLAFAHAFFYNHFGPWPHAPWMNGPFRPEWFGPAVLQFVWVFVALRAALLFAAGW